MLYFVPRKSSADWRSVSVSARLYIKISPIRPSKLRCTLPASWDSPIMHSPPLSLKLAVMADATVDVPDGCILS